MYTDFFREDEFNAARSIIEGHIGQRLPRRKGTGRLRTGAEDIVNKVLNPENQFPTFYATDLSRLPPVDIKHCDVSALLLEIQGVRSEIRGLRRVEEDVQRLQLEVAELRQQLKSAETSSSGQTVGSIDEFPPLPSHKQSTVLVNQKAAPAKNYSSRAQELASNPEVFQTRGRSQQQLVVGSSSTNQHVKSVATQRTIDVFVSRLLPTTEECGLADCVHAAKEGIPVHSVVCHRLKAKYETLYASFHVEIGVDSMDIKRALGKFMSAEAWPNGIFAKRFFKRKNGSDK